MVAKQILSVFNAAAISFLLATPGFTSGKMLMEFKATYRVSRWEHGSRHVRNLKNIKASCAPGEFINGLKLGSNGARFGPLRKYRWETMCMQPIGKVPHYTCETIPRRSDVINTGPKRWALGLTLGLSGLFNRGSGGLGVGCSAPNQALSSWALDSYVRCQGPMCLGRSGRSMETWSKCCSMPKTVWKCGVRQSAKMSLARVNIFGRNTLDFIPIKCGHGEVMRSWQYHKKKFAGPFSRSHAWMTYECCSMSQY